MDVEIRRLPALRVAAVRHVGAYDRISEAFERLGHIAGQAALFKQPGTQMVALYHDNPRSIAEEKLRSDAGLTLPAGAPLPKGLTEQRVPAGDYASTVHVGPYEQLGEVWARLMGEWLPASGRKVVEDAPSLEIYLNDPTTTPKHELKTEIRIPVSA